MKNRLFGIVALEERAGRINALRKQVREKMGTCLVHTGARLHSDVWLGTATVRQHVLLLMVDSEVDRESEQL